MNELDSFKTGDLTVYPLPANNIDRLAPLPKDLQRYHQLRRQNPGIVCVVEYFWPRFDRCTN